MTNRSTKGFTLIEVMVALVTLGIGLMAVMGLHFSSLRSDIRNRDESRALFLANQKIEEIRSQDFASVVSGQDYSAHPYDMEWSVTAPQAWRKDVVVTVSWPEKVKSVGGDSHNKQRSVQVATIIAQLN